MPFSDESQVYTLLAADKTELLSVLGAAALAIDNSPAQLLEAGRSGQFYSAGPTVLGPEIPFEHSGLTRAATDFLTKWNFEIRKAICGNEKLYAAETKEVGRHADLWVATIVSTLATHIKALAPFVVVLNILAALIVRTGLKAFCDEILPAG